MGYSEARGPLTYKKKPKVEILMSDSLNLREQGKIRTIYCGGEQDGYPSHPPFHFQRIWDYRFEANLPWSGDLRQTRT